MKMLFENHSFATARCMEFVDVTDDLLRMVERSGVRAGMETTTTSPTATPIAGRDCSLRRRRPSRSSTAGCSWADGSGCSSSSSTEPGSGGS